LAEARLWWLASGKDKQTNRASVANISYAVLSSFCMLEMNIEGYHCKFEFEHTIQSSNFQIVKSIKRALESR